MTAALAERVARICCYWADQVKNGTCLDAYCIGGCAAVMPEKQFTDMAAALLADGALGRHSQMPDDSNGLDSK